jgi:hypothetical protein
MAILIITIIGLVVSLVFNALQWTWRKQDLQERADEKSEQAKKEQQRAATQRQKEEAPPQFYNADSSAAPIKITGMAHAAQGPFVDVWGIVTIVNPTSYPMKISLAQLVLNGNSCPISRMFFRERGRIATFERISVRGNDKEDYELHFLFPDNDYPNKPSRAGQLWVSSDNCPERFPVEITCP